MIFNSVLFCAVSAIVFDYTDGQQCNANGLKKYDSTFAKLLTLGGSGRKFPENEQEEFKKFCDQSFEYIIEIDKFKNKCMDQLAKQMTGVVVYSVKSAINKYCKRSSKRRTDLINGFTCANRAKAEYDQCYTNLIDSFIGAKNAKEKNRIPHTCCEYYKLYDCIMKKAGKNKNCSENQIDMANSFIRELFGNLVDILCTEYTEGSDKCDTLGPPPKKKRSQRRTKSFMLPYFEVLSSLSEQPNL